MVKKSKDLYELLARRNPADGRESARAKNAGGSSRNRGGNAAAEGGPNLMETAKGLLGAVGRVVSGTGTPGGKPGGAAGAGKARGNSRGKDSARKPANSLETVARRKGDIRASLPPSGFVVHGPILAGMLLIALVAGFGLGQVVELGGDAPLKAGNGGSQPVAPGPVGLGEGITGANLSEQNLQEPLSNKGLLTAIYSAPERALAAAAARHLVRNGVTTARLRSVQGHWLVVIHVGMSGAAPTQQELEAIRQQMRYVPDPSNDPVFASARSSERWLGFIELPPS